MTMPAFNLPPGVSLNDIDPKELRCVRCDKLVDDASALNAASLCDDCSCDAQDDNKSD